MSKMKKKENKWTIGRGIGIGLSAIAIAIVLSFLIVATQKEITKFQYSNCLKKGYDVDLCMPLMNDDYYPNRGYEKPLQPLERKPIEVNETDD
jgi:hypothetical protein